MADKLKADAPATARANSALARRATGGQLTVPAPPPPPLDSLAPKRWSWWVWAGLVAAAVVAGGLWYFQPWVSKAAEVQVETVAPGPISRVLAVNGRIAPLHSVDVKANVAGEVLEVSVTEGQTVALGDLLARIDATAQQAVVRQSLAAMDAGLVAQAQAVATLARTTALGDNVARTVLDDATSAVQTADQDVARLIAFFDQAQAGLASYTLRAPMSGTVLARNAEIGQSIDAAVPLFVLADLDQLIVETDVDEAFATQIAIGQRAVLQLVGEAETLPGHVSFVAPQVDQKTGGLTVKLAFDAAIAAPVGLTVTANITVDRQAAAISVPRAAVVSVEAKNAVFVVLNGVVQRREVSVVHWPAERLVVTKGLAAGDVVIVDPIALTQGQAVTIAATADPNVGAN